MKIVGFTGSAADIAACELADTYNGVVSTCPQTPQDKWRLSAVKPNFVVLAWDRSSLEAVHALGGLVVNVWAEESNLDLVWGVQIAELIDVSWEYDAQDLLPPTEVWEYLRASQEDSYFQDLLKAAQRRTEGLYDWEVPEYKAYPLGYHKFVFEPPTPPKRTLIQRFFGW